MRRSPTAVLACALACVLVVAVPVFRDGGDAHAQDASRARVPFVTIDPTDASPADESIERSQERLRTSPQDDGARLALALGFLQKVGEVSDPTFYGRADRLLRDLRSRRPRNPDVLVASGMLALSQHHFEAAHTLGERALRVAPANATAYGILVDASNELGRYRRALRETQAMMDANPNLPALARVSYARELRGDPQGAILAIEDAITAGSTVGGDDVAFAHALRGQLLLATGDTNGAAQAYATAEASAPGYGPALAGQAQVLVARGMISDAVPVLRRVLADAPVAQDAIDLGNALHALGQDAAAERAYAQAREIDRRELEQGVDVRVEMAAFAADHDPGPAAVALARDALAAGPTTFAHDALAWNLYRVGQIEEATRQSRQALSLGSRDPRLRFHAAAIAFAGGNRAAATRHLRVVLDGNPRFDAFLQPEVDALARRLDMEIPEPAS